MRTQQWQRLDTAAKIYPPSTTKKNTMVFRLVCELTESVDKDILQHALDISLETSPFYRSVLRHGLFWYYLETSDIKAEVHEESSTPCTQIYDENRHGLLFSLTYYRKRINLEMFHALADADGALNFLKSILHHYLIEKYKDELSKNNIRVLKNCKPPDQKSTDAFDTYYSKEKAPKQEKSRRSYCMKGERFPEERFGIIEGHVSTDALLNKCHELNATVSELLVSLVIWSFKGSMKRVEEIHPVAVQVPINLRKYFRSNTERNFLGFFDASHNYSTQGKTFDDVLNSIKNTFKNHLTPANLQGQLNWSTSLDHAAYIKIVPLPLKSVVMKNVVSFKNTKTSATFSNIGSIDMPSELQSYVRLFSIYCSVKQLYVGVCTFGGITSISFTSPYINPGVQRTFFRTLSEYGIDVELVANTQELSGDDA
ncbi:hypothetical protein FACS1894102_1770 [Spirochaetia bacterium]|nr:hypothetical protein FACS1894102_1770 [Spirochaetia bacterium]